MNKQKLPKGWKKVELEEISIVDSGQGAPQGSRWFNGNNIFVRAGDLNSLSEGKYVGDYCEKITDEAIKEYKLKKYSAGSIVFPKSGMSIMTDNIAILKYDSYVVNHLAIVEPNDSNDSKFIYYLLKKVKTSTLSKNTSYPSIRISDVQTFKIFWPESAIRLQIVKFIEKAEKAKEWRKEADELTKDFINSIFSGMFLESNKFKEVELGNKDIYEEFFAGGDVPKDRLSNEKTDKYNIPIFTNGEKKKGFYGYTNKARVTKDSLTISARGTIGYSEIRKGSFFPAIRLIVITPKEEVLNLYYLKYAIDNIKFNLGATSIPQLTVPDCKRFKIPMPPIELQNKFASIVKEVESMKEQQKHSKEQIDNIFNALMQKAFKGELI